MPEFYNLLKDGGALYALAIGFTVLIRGVFILRQHHLDVVAGRDALLAEIKAQRDAALREKADLQQILLSQSRTVSQAVGHAQAVTQVAAAVAKTEARS